MKLRRFARSAVALGGALAGAAALLAIYSGAEQWLATVWFLPLVAVALQPREGEQHVRDNPAPDRAASTLALVGVMAEAAVVQLIAVDWFWPGARIFAIAAAPLCLVLWPLRTERRRNPALILFVGVLVGVGLTVAWLTLDAALASGGEAGWGISLLSAATCLVALRWLERPER
jgi:hypothetical protein